MKVHSPEHRTQPDWDAIIVGGSAAGLSAALMLGRARRRVLVIDSGEPRNRFADEMHGVLGNEGTAPAALVRRGRDETARYGVEFASGTVSRLENAPHGVRVIREDSDAGRIAEIGRALIVATGITDLLPEIPGLAERWGTTVLHCPYCHGWQVADQRLGVLATSPAALHQAQLVRQWSDRITLFSAGMGPVDDESVRRLRSRGVEIVESAVTEVLGEGTAIRAVRCADGQEIPVQALFTMGTPQPRDHFRADLNLERAELPFGMGTVMHVDPTGRTSHPRVWAAGNVVNPMANVPMAIGAASFVGGSVNGFLVEEDFDLALEERRD